MHNMCISFGPTQIVKSFPFYHAVITYYFREKNLFTFIVQVYVVGLKQLVQYMDIWKGKQINQNYTSNVC